MDDLTTLGWDARLREEFEQYRSDGLVPGRVAVQHRGAWDVLTELGELRVDAAGRLRHDTANVAELPVVGDWVAIAARSDESGGTIHAVLQRRTKVSRKTAWQATEEQVLVANVDVIFLVTSVNEDLNPRRLERYLTLAWESGAQPVFVLTKSDLVDDIAPAAAIVESVAFGVPVMPVSSVTGDGVEEVRAYLPAGVTGAFIGSSGVGKSTLVNSLAGAELLETREIREDGRGRHTTVRRELTYLEDRPWDYGGGRATSITVRVDAGYEIAFLQAAGPEAAADQDTDGSVRVHISAVEPAAVVNLVLGFLDHAEIIDPPNVRAMIVTALEAWVA